MPTPHINAEPGDFAEDVLMPGDPNRARRIAELVLEDHRMVNDVRGILGFTGTYQGRPLSVLGSGMGMPSMTIYATELVRFLGVKRIVRVGTCGGLQQHISLNDVVVGLTAHTDSAMTLQRVPGLQFSHGGSFLLARAAVAGAERLQPDRPVWVGPVLTSDHFYLERPEFMHRLAALGTLAVEMEAAALYAVAAAEGCEALAVMTVSDHLLHSESLTSAEREEGFRTALDVALAALAP